MYLIMSLLIMQFSAKCGELDDPANGVVTVNGFYVGATATYSCNPTFQIFGITTRVCQEGAQWSGTEPRCVDGELIPELCYA